MGFGIVIAFAIIGFALVGIVGYLSHLSAKRRREALAATATERGWAFTARDDRWAERFDGQPFGVGHSRQAHNIITGDHDGRGFVAFDYRYSTTETTRNADGTTSTSERVHPFSIVALQTGAAFPRLRVRPEGVFGRLFGRLAGTDIELESEEFNRAFTVTCENRRFAVDVLHPRMMEYLLGHRELSWDLRNETLLTAKSGQHSIAELDLALTAIDGILDRIPDLVWRAGRADAAEPDAPRRED